VSPHADRASDRVVRPARGCHRSFPTLWDASVALAGPCSVRGYCGETACAPVLMANVAPPVPTGIDGIDRSTRISRVAQGADHEPECFLGRGGGHGRWSTKANGGHEQHCLTITGYPLYRNAQWWRARCRRETSPPRINPGKSWLEQSDDGGGSLDQPHQWKTNRGEDEWKGERQENSQRHIREHGQGPVSRRRLWSGDVDDRGSRHALWLLSGAALSGRARHTNSRQSSPEPPKHGAKRDNDDGDDPSHGTSSAPIPFLATLLPLPPPLRIAR